MTFPRARTALLTLVTGALLAGAASTAAPAQALECTPTLNLQATATVEYGQSTFVYAAVKGCEGMTVATKLESSTDLKTWKPLPAAVSVTMNSDWAMMPAFDDYVPVASTTAFRFTAGDQVVTRTTTVAKLRTQLNVDAGKRIDAIGATLTRYASTTKLGGRRLAVQTRTSATAPWRTTGWLTTNTYGYAATELRPLVAADYRLLYPGDSRTAASATGARRIAGYVRALPVIKGTYHRYSTKVTRADGRPIAGLTVRLYKKVPGGYKYVTSAVTSSKGYATRTLRPTTRTTYAWLWPGSYTWQSADSANFTVYP